MMDDEDVQEVLSADSRKSPAKVSDKSPRTYQSARAPLLKESFQYSPNAAAGANKESFRSSVSSSKDSRRQNLMDVVNKIKFNSKITNKEHAVLC